MLHSYASEMAVVGTDLSILRSANDRLGLQVGAIRLVFANRAASAVCCRCSPASISLKHLPDPLAGPAVETVVNRGVRAIFGRAIAPAGPLLEHG